MNKPANYRYRDLKPGDAYYEAWRGYRRTLRVGSALTLFFIITSVADMTFGVPEQMIWAEIWIFIFGFGYVGECLWGMRCPSCGEKWGTRWRGPSRIGACRNCHLPKYAPDDLDKETADA